MFSLQRSSMLAGAAVAVLAVAATVSPRTTAASPSAAAVPPPCRPQTAGTELRDPPLWTPSPANHKLLVLHVRQNGSAVFCYQIEGQTSYFEAPTIQVHQGETWRMVLKNDLSTPSPAASPGMSPRPAPTATDGCDQLGTMGRPPDDSSGVLGIRTPDPRTKADDEMHAMDEANVGDTNFHTHGWDVSPAVDNVFKSTTHSSSKEGGPRSCTFTFDVPASQSAGTYWYHAHLHGVARTQVGGGLAGALIVVPATAPRVPEPPTRVIVIKNLTAPPSATPVPAFIAAVGPQARILKNASGPTPNPASPTFPPPKVAGTVWSGMFLTFSKTGQCGWGSAPSPAPAAKSGQKLMLNGVRVPLNGENAPLPSMRVAREERVRIVNATSDSFVNLWMRVGTSGAEDLRVIARDGVDVDPTHALHPLPYKRLLLAPGNRADILVAPGAADRTLATDFVCTGALGNIVPAQNLLALPRNGARMLAAAAPRANLSAGATSAAAFYKRFAPRVIRNRELTFTQYDSYGHFYVTDTTNRAAHGFGERPFWLEASKTPNDPDHYMLPNITVTQDDTEIWTLVNAAAEIHAFHIHQMTFLTLDTTDPVLKPELTNAKLDVAALAPARIYQPLTEYTAPGDTGTYPALVPSRTRILINFGVVHPGTFVYHCHMLAHEDSGMMGIITALPRRTAH